MPNIEIVYALEDPPDVWQAAIFLAGPTPRSPEAASWRPMMIELLAGRWSGDGLLVIFVPEYRHGRHDDYRGQVDWEERCLHLADVVLFWVPRDLDVLPAFTTNVEWGMWHDSGRVVFGAPPEAPNNRYLLHYAAKFDVPVATTADGTADAALREIGAGALRRGGERSVPLMVWRTPGFQRWYAAQTAAGNTLRGGRVVWTFQAAGALFYWALRAEVHVAAEDRMKTSEVVLSRPDVSVVVLYRRAAVPDETRVVLVREFRTAGHGFVHELPGGSGPGEPAEQALAEVAEETGLRLDPARLRAHAVRQVVATLSAHQARLFSAELTDDELAAIVAGGPYGNSADGELTVPEIVTFGELRSAPLADWATVGMVAQVLLG
jgi:8-oxo-dGTP pyrophosphatase MutT (NUDIX family)